ncbi:MAG: hypothetical protein NTV97_11355 [Alphaproteobacteria bacterium]|nr:hypothetical protein [Alphaproteobacteria bacterium]
MTKHLPPEILLAGAAMPIVPRGTAQFIFKGRPAWMAEAALAALADMRPDLGIVVDRSWLAVHLWKWPRDDDYYAGVMSLLKRYGVGEP